jgi:hypothetical protein
MEGIAAGPHHAIVVLLDHADEKTGVVVVEDLAINDENLVAVPDCGHTLPLPCSFTGRAGACD